MILRILIGTAVLVGLAGWADRAPEWPHSGPMPDEPGHETSQRYKPIDEGTLSYRPVEPMPWGDVNSRVAPPGAVPAPPPSSDPAAKSPSAPKPGAQPAPMDDMKGRKGMGH